MDKAAELKAEYGKAKLEANNAEEDEDVSYFLLQLCVSGFYLFLHVYIVLNLILGSLANYFGFLLIHCGFFVIFQGNGGSEKEVEEISDGEQCRLLQIFMSYA